MDLWFGDMGIRFGLQLWNQVFDWDETAVAAQTAEELGYDELWSSEHLLAVMGDPYQDTFDGYTLLSAWSQLTSRLRLGLLTGANTFRAPGLLAKMITTLDHVSGGRAVLGLGGGWHEQEHVEYGIEFGTGWADRLGWLDESAAALRGLLDGETVTSPENGHYALTRARLHPLPVQERLPILIGGGGEQRTLRTVAKYADIWNWVGLEDLDRMRHKEAVLRERCEEIGRDHTEIERSAYVSPVIRDTPEEARSFFRTQIKANRLDEDVVNDPDIYLTTPEQMTNLMLSWKELGFTSFIIQTASPLDTETIERIAKQVRPRVEAVQAPHA